MNGYAKHFDKRDMYMNPLVNDKQVQEKYNVIWNIIRSLFKKEFDSEPVYNDKYIKSKTKF